MKRFAELLLNLILTSSRNDKIDHIVNWIKDSNSEEIGWGLSIICEELEISKVKPSMVKEISKLHIDKYLFDLSYDVSEFSLSKDDINSLIETVDVYAKVIEPGLARVIMFSMQGDKVMELSLIHISEPTRPY